MQYTNPEILAAIYDWKKVIERHTSSVLGAKPQQKRKKNRKRNFQMHFPSVTEVSYQTKDSQTRSPHYIPDRPVFNVPATQQHWLHLTLSVLNFQTETDAFHCYSKAALALGSERQSHCSDRKTTSVTTRDVLMNVKQGNQFCSHLLTWICCSTVHLVSHLKPFCTCNAFWPACMNFSAV